MKSIILNTEQKNKIELLLKKRKSKLVISAIILFLMLWVSPYILKGGSTGLINEIGYFKVILLQLPLATIPIFLYYLIKIRLLVLDLKNDKIIITNAKISSIHFQNGVNIIKTNKRNRLFLHSKEEFEASKDIEFELHYLPKSKIILNYTEK
tara:strand:- start:50 stop:505 length:456 start_codon:yes stop_codon:yes gene_type:complete